MDILEEAKRLLPELTELRRTLHRFPELAGNETKTVGFICSALNAFGVSFVTPAHNIVLASLGPETADSVAYRTDIDALPIKEASGMTYASENPGVMHACGHDAHTAIALCCAKILKSLENRLTRRVIIIFQPSEETGEGAEQTLRTGALRGVSRIYGLHVDPMAPAGTILVSPGPVNMGSGKFRITIKGKSGHGSTPHLCRDALLCGCRIVTDAQIIVQQSVSCLSPALISIGRLESDGAWNVISDNTAIDGLFRYSDASSEPIVIDKLRNIVDSNAAITGCTGNLEYTPNATPIVNDYKLSETVKSCALSFGLKIAPEPLCPIADDFAAYQRTAKGCFFRCGVGSDAPGNENFPLHSDRFRLEESSLVNPLAVISGVLSSA